MARGVGSFCMWRAPSEGSARKVVCGRGAVCPLGPQKKSRVARAVADAWQPLTNNQGTGRAGGRSARAHRWRVQRTCPCHVASNSLVSDMQPGGAEVWCKGIDQARARAPSRGGGRWMVRVYVPEQRRRGVPGVAAQPRLAGFSSRPASCGAARWEQGPPRHGGRASSAQGVG